MLAEQVFIHSNHFSFMLDKQMMMIPVWVDPRDFPVDVDTSVGGTTMFLKFLPEMDSAIISEQLAILDPWTLCFLKKLRSVFSCQESTVAFEVAHTSDANTCTL